MNATPLMENLALGVAGSLMAAIIGGASVYLYRVGFLSECCQPLLAIFHPTSKVFPDHQNSSQKIRGILLRRLRRGQTLWPWSLHYGQFGKGIPSRTGRFQGTQEPADVKPRMYLTSWPGIIMARRNVSIRNVVWATKGVLRLLARHGDNRVHVLQSVGPDEAPTGEPRVISFRHTICGAWFVYSVQGWNPITREIVDSMLDQHNDWQNKDGGWALCDHEHYRASDLWASAYAAEMLDKALSEGVLAEAQQSLARDALTRTLQYFKETWQNNRWALRKSQSEENAVYTLVELAPFLRTHDRLFLQEIVRHVGTWLSPAGYLSHQYVSKLLVNPDLSSSALNARMSYALYRAGEKASVWEPLYRQAVKTLDERLNSADLAFLLDLTFVVVTPRLPRDGPTTAPPFRDSS
jgi:hypothetical protein